MIFPDVTLEEWLKRYPDLDVVSRDCDQCGKKIIASIPFVSIDLVGLTAPRCSCGKNRFTCGSSLTRTPEVFQDVLEALS